MAVLAACAGDPLLAQAQGIDFEKIAIRTENVAPNIYALTGSADVDPGHLDGAGGRIIVLVGPEGVFMVDAQYAPLTDRVLAAIAKISPSPIRFLVNTHSHPDHTGGNANIAKHGALLFSRDETRDQMRLPLPAIAAALAPQDDPARLPVVTYGTGSVVKIRLNNEVIDLVALPPAHTGGDTIVRFEKADVIAIGDIYSNYGYPFIDTHYGGAVKGLLEALDITAKLAGPDTKLAPGHGTIVKRAEIIAQRDMILEVQALVQRMIASGKSEEEVLAAKLTAPYDAKVRGALTPLPAGLGTSTDRFVRAIYTELKRRQGS
jgi:glyoxylase-like metal-dependent hydrolase (beta-lactamase superfamily II)